MKKIGLICLAVVLGLGAMGGALAYWNETLTIAGSVATGELDVEFSAQKSNDDGTQLDPSECGTWTMSNLKDSTGWTWGTNRYAFDVGKTICALVDADGNPAEGGSYNNGNEKMTITVTNAYPCYYAHVAFSIDNLGTIPAHIKSIQLTALEPVHDGGLPIVLVAGIPRELDADGDGDKDLSLCLTTLAVSQNIAVGGALPGDLCIHVMDGADEVDTYTFTIEIVCNQFNAP